MGLKVPARFHVDNDEGEDISDQYCFKLLNNCYGSKDAAANWFTVLSNGLQERGFTQSPIDPCLFTRDDCIIVTYIDKCLIFLQEERYIEKFNTIIRKWIQIDWRRWFSFSSWNPV